MLRPQAISARCSSSAPIPFRTPNSIPPRFQNTFLIVQDLFLTETAALADVVLPAASLYEKSGTVTNTFGDIQIVRKAADRAGVKPDFEILVRLAGGMGVDVKHARSLRHERAAPPAISANRAARSPAKPTATPSGLKPTASNPNSAPSIRSPCSTKSSASFPATPSIASISSPATTCTPSRPALAPDSFPSPRSPRRNSSFPRTILSSPQARWAVTARRSGNLNNIRQRNLQNRDSPQTAAD